MVEKETNMAIINVKNERREKFINSFEEKGFKIDKRFSKNEIIKSVLPITLDFKTKEIGRMGNVTCACVALSQGLIMNDEEFLEQWNVCSHQ